ncbi:MAG: 5-formyltetrahydrofolate cyclo-ligase [Woeseiaceae bacterium]
MTHTPVPSMKDLRRTALLARRALTDDERAIASARIVSRVVRSREFSAANTLACYLPMREEVDTTRIIARAWRAKKRIFAPVVDSVGGMTFRELRPETLLERNRFALWEPVGSAQIAAKDLDLVITPLVAFDRNLNRIGMGGGYFDRCFAFLKHRRNWLRPKLVGVAFDCQHVEKIEPNHWDIPLYRIFSDHL